MFYVANMSLSWLTEILLMMIMNAKDLLKNMSKIEELIQKAKEKQAKDEHETKEAS